MISPTRSNQAPIVWVVTLGLLLVGGLIFRDFLFGDKLLLYTDAGGDSVNDTYPTFIHLSDYIRHDGFPLWSFCVGMGQNILYLAGNLVWDPVAWLPRDWIASAMVFQQLAKAVIAGLLFGLFLRRRGLNVIASLGGALSLAFSAHMGMGSCWIISADDTVCFTFLLLAAEEALTNRRWVWLAVAVALSGLITAFHLYLSAILLTLYIPTRFVELHGWKPGRLIYSCVVLAGVAVVGVGLGAVISLGSFYEALHSARGSHAVGNISRSVSGPFQFGSLLYYVTAILRSFSPDLLGTGDGYRGWENYYESSLSYCGLLPLLIFPQIFFGATRQQRILCCLFLAFIVVPVVFPWFRSLFWLFYGGYFRTYSLFSIFVLLVFSMSALSRYVERQVLSVWMLLASLAGLLGVLYWALHVQPSVVDHDLVWIAGGFLCVYSAVLVTGHLVRQHQLAAVLILAIVAVELVYFDRITINRPTLAGRDLKERIGYNDETVDAVRDIKKSDRDFFRITKPWGSAPGTNVSFNDAMVFNYYGTSSYSTYNSLDYINFLRAVGSIDEAHIKSDVQWAPGLIGHPLLLTFAGERYLLAPDALPPASVQEYQFIRQYNGFYLYRNNFALPLGLVFHYYLPENLFSALPEVMKGPTLLHAAVLAEPQAGLASLTREQLEQEINSRAIPDILVERRDTGFHIDSFKQSHIAGRVGLRQNGIVVFQMPFNKGWRCIVDGHSVAPIKADVGLLGVPVPQGDHALELVFRPPLLEIGALITAVSLVIFLFSLWRWPRIRGIS